MGQDSTGKKILKDFYGHDEAAARAKYDSWMRAHPSGPPSADQRQTLNDLLATWVEKMKPSYALSTYEDTLSIIRVQIAPFIGRTPLCDLTTLQIDTWLTERYTQHGHGRVLERALSIIRAALHQAIVWKILTENPATQAKPPKFRRRKAKALNFPQALALIAAAEGRLDLRKPYKTAHGFKHLPKLDARLGFLYLLAVILGLRKGELLALRWCALDETAGLLTISASRDTRGRERDTKTESSNRTIPIDEHLVDAWRHHRMRQQTESHQEGWKPDGLVFSTRLGTPLSQRNLDRHFKHVLAAAGLPDMRFHDLRHTAGSLMLAEGGQMVDVSRTLGHASAAVTQKIYAHSYEEGQRKAIAGISQKMKRGS